MSRMLPPARPRAGLDLVSRLAAEHYTLGDALPRVYVLGVRGYYRDTMGAAGTNDRGIYDDALFVVTPTVFRSYNANTDPSRWRAGIATLIPGCYPYRMGKHGISRPGGGYPAFRPATKDEELPVMRDGRVSPSVGIAINIHKGGYTTTSSAGCQTIHPEQWPSFYGTLSAALLGYGQKTFPYILILGPIT